MPTLTPSLWLLLVFVLVPGFVANRVYALWCPGQKQDWEKALLEPLTWSAINLLFWCDWVFTLINTEKFADINREEMRRAILLVCLVSPAAMSTAWYHFRIYAHGKFKIDYPVAKAWDYFLKQNNEGFYILFHLKNKSKIGGLFASKSYATTYPQEPEIYVEQVFKVDQITGEFIERIEGTYGSVIRQSEWDFIEFHKIPEGCPDDDSSISGGDSGAATTGATGTEGGAGTTETEPATGGVWFSSSEETTTKEVGGESTCRTTKNLLVWSETKPKD